jgi:hypothetical protein
VFGAEIAVGYVFAWLVRKARHVGQHADGQVDAALDAGVDRLGEKLHALVAGGLQNDAALERLTAEAQLALDAPSPRVVQRVALALEDAAADDPQFGSAVEDLVRQLQAAERAAGLATATDRGAAISGNVNVHVEGDAFGAAVVTGDVNLGNPRLPDTGRR